MNFEDLFLQLSTTILESFPSLNIYVEKAVELDEYFILIDSEEIYFSESFQSLISQINVDILWRQNEFNVYFSYEESPAFSTCSFESDERVDTIPYYFAADDEYTHTYSQEVNFELSMAA